MRSLPNISRLQRTGGPLPPQDQVTCSDYRMGTGVTLTVPGQGPLTRQERRDHMSTRTPPAGLPAPRGNACP